MADRLVIDSAAFDHPGADLTRLGQMISSQKRALRISDLNWGRLTSWRSLLATFWDVAAYRPMLASLDQVTIEYRPSPEAPDEVGSTALLLAGWLTARLGWELTTTAPQDDGTRVEFDLKSKDRSLKLLLVRDHTAERHDRMISAITVSATSQSASFSVALRANGTRLETEAKIGSEQSLGRLLAYERRSDADRLSRELSFLSRDTIYEEAVEYAAQFVAALGKQQP
jgi:glucose-6-phosphate dehydrogenase assembly protein OpcA